jgi:hypothetical protein
MRLSVDSVKSNDHILNRGKTVKEALLRDNIGTPPLASIEKCINPNNKKNSRKLFAANPAVS